MAKAIYAGSFDPITNGHVWVIDQALKMFDKVYVAVGVNPDKKSSFTLEDRTKMINNAFPNESKIEVVSFQKEFLVNFCSMRGIDVMIRGIRNVQDFEYEQQILYINEKINSSIQTVYIIPPAEYAGLSSSMVKGLLGFSEWQFIAKDLIPKDNLKFLMNLAFSGKKVDEVMKYLGVQAFLPKFYEAYNGTGRFYHTVQHINEMLAEYETIGAKAKLREHADLEQGDPMVWAILFHDFVYNPASGSNEEDSVLEWEDFFEKCRPIVDGDKVSKLIMATKSHESHSADMHEKFMIDLDFAILASDTNRFNEYERQIRFEYSFVNDGVYKAGRIDFVKKLLARNSIFLTETFQNKYESKARKNLNELVYALERT